MKKTVLIVAIFVLALFLSTKSVDAANIQGRQVTQSAVNGTGTITITKPSDVSTGVLMVAFIHQDGGIGVSYSTEPTGWSKVNSTQICNSADCGMMYYKIATGSEPANYTWTLNSSRDMTGWITSYTGGYSVVDTYTTAVPSSGPPHVWPSINTTVANALVVLASGNAGYSGATYTNSPPSGWNEIANYTVSGSDFVSGYDKIQASAGATGTPSLDFSQAGYGASMWTVAFKTGTSATTTGNGGYSYNYFYSSGNITNNTGNTVSYGTAWGAGSGYSGTACSALPYKTDYSTVANGFNGAVSAQVSGASANTLYYFCVYVKDGGTYYYSPTTSSVTTSSVPQPSISNFGAILVDDTTAVLTAGINSYGVSSNGYFRYGISPTYTTGSACSSLPNTTTNASSGSNDGNLYPRTAQINSLTPGATYVYCFQSTSSSAGYSTVVSFTASATGSTGCSLFPNSSLANASDSTTVKGFLGTSKMQGTLLYKASVNGWTPTNFHTAVDNQGPTLILMRNSSNGKIFGAYAPKAWNSAGSWMAGAGALLFSISDNYSLSQVNYADYMMLGQSLRAPYMGGAGNLAGPYNQNMNTAGSWSNGNNASYWEQPSSKGAFTYLSGSSSFAPDEIEVYALSVCTASAPTVSLGSPSHGSETYSSALLSGDVTSQGTASIIDRGVCVSENPDPVYGGTGLTGTGQCYTTSGTTGTYSVSATGLTANRTYHFRMYARNSVGPGYSSDDTFQTPNNLPTSTDTASAASVNSFYATLRGAANPNGFQTYGHFRVFTANPGNCNSDSGGNRYPENAGPSYDINLGSGTTLITHLTNPSFQFTIPFTAGAYLVPNTTYWYCAYAVGANGTGGASSVQSFITPDGQASPCDPPTSGNLTIPAGSACSFDGSFGGVDEGSGTQNSGVLTVAAGASLTVNTGQQIAFGSLVPNQGAEVVMQQGASLVGGGAYVADADSDGVIDSQTQYVGSSPPGGYRRRNLLSTTYNYSWKIASSGASLDCNSASAYVNRNIAALVTDADNDGYKTSAASNTQCVGTQSTINGRTYFKDASNNSSFMLASQVQGGGATDCQDNPAGGPCAPTNTSASAASTSQINLSWGVNSAGGAVPAVTGYDVQICGLNDTTCASYSTQSVSSATYSYGDSGIACSTSPSYYYRIVAKHTTNGNTNSSIFSGVTSTCCSNGYKDYDGDGYGAGSNSCWAPSASYSVVGTGTDCYDYDGANSTTRTQSRYAKPGQTSYYTIVRGAPSNVNDWAGNSWNSYDYNCDGNYTNTLTNTTTAPGSMPTRTYCSGTGPTNIYSGYTYCSFPCEPYCCGMSNACDPHTYCSSYTTAQIVCGNSYTLFSSGPSYTTYYYADFCSGGNNQNIPGYYEANSGSQTVSCR